jgi:DNA-binding response OmpR family regulator
MRRILVVEDDRIIADGLAQALRAEGYEVVVARDGQAGLHEAQVCRPDLLIVDVMMPHLNGFELTTELRRRGDRTPIIVLSARTETKDKIRGLDLGADDYLAKPFEIDELLARVRRRLDVDASRTSVVGAGIFDWQTSQLFDGDGRVVPLLGKELLLLSYFLKRPRQIVSREQIIGTVWGDSYEGSDRTVDNFVAGLRKKIGQDQIATVRGLGYRFTGGPAGTPKNTAP